MDTLVSAAHEAQADMGSEEESEESTDNDDFCILEAPGIGIPVRLLLSLPWVYLFHSCSFSVPWVYLFHSCSFSVPWVYLFHSCSFSLPWVYLFHSCSFSLPWVLPVS